MKLINKYFNYCFQQNNLGNIKIN